MFSSLLQQLGIAGETTENEQTHVVNTAALTQLVNMGFDREIAMMALGQNQNNINRSVDWITSQRDATMAAATTRAVQLQAPSRPVVSVTKPQPTKQTHSTDTLQAIGSRLALYPTAVETLIFVLKSILQDPHNEKFRNLKTSNSRFQQTLGQVPVAETFLLQCGFTRAGDWLSLAPIADLNIVQTALGILNSVQTTSTYQNAWAQLEFEKAVRESRESASEEEKRRRVAMASRIPIEPELGAAGSTRVSEMFGGGTKSNNNAMPFKRRFHSDDTLQDVINWLGSHSSIIPRKLDLGEWSLVDVTLLVKRPINLQSDRDKTLHALGFWPSCELEIVTA